MRARSFALVCSLESLDLHKRACTRAGVCAGVFLMTGKRGEGGETVINNS